jgi:hypothetical protein
MAKNGEVQMGQKVECLVTGFAGTVVSITQYLYGVRRIGIQPLVDKDGKIPEGQDVDEPQVKIVDENKVLEADSKPLSFDLGQEAEDPITGYKGTIIGYCDFINGCRRVGIQQKYDSKNHKEFDSGKWFYEPQIKVIKKEPRPEVNTSETARRTGGPGMMPSFKANKVKV